MPNDLALGAAAGFSATALMTLFEYPFWRRIGIGGVVEWEVNQILVSWILTRDHTRTQGLRGALGMHLLHGTVAGALLGVALTSLAPGARSVYWFAGLALSLLLWSVVPFIFRGAFEEKGRVRFSRLGMFLSFLSHVVYGVSLGFLLQILL